MSDILEDFEAKWKCIGGADGRNVYEHTDYEHLLRVIDIPGKTVHFTDRLRVIPKNIIDINRALPDLRKIRITPHILRVIDAEKPITMPYTPEKLKVYVEDLTKYLGILYFMDENKDLTRITRFFKASDGLNYVEVSFDEYSKYKEEMENVDSNTEQAKNN
jgi:hypothetical protein